MKGNYGKKFLSLMLSAIMVMGMLPVNAFATDDVLDGITIINECRHHEHDAACGYVAAVEGADCTHTHDATCGFAEPVPAKECTCGAAEDAEHAEDCAYAAEIPGTPCNHVHDAACGYIEAVEGKSCTFDDASCLECNPVEEEEDVVECTEHDYDDDGFCTVCGAEEVYLPCDVDGCELVKGHLGDHTGAALYVEAVGGVYSVATETELKDAIEKAADGETVKLTADITVDQLQIYKPITLNLGGNTLTTTSGYGGILLKEGPSVVNGNIIHEGKTAAIKAFKAEVLENLVIDVTYDGSDGPKVIGGIVVQNKDGKYIDSIKDVTIKGVGLTNGIETYNCGDEDCVIGTMENVTIDAVGTGMLLSAPCGTATGCTIKGGVTGIDMLLKGTYSVSINLVDCEVYGGEKAVYAHDEQAGYTYEGTLELTVDSATTFDTKEGGKLLVTEIANPEDADLSDVEIQVWDGVIDDLAELEWFRDQVNGGNTFAGKTVKLTATIDLSSVDNWTPIGNASNPFWGTFDGQNNIIENMTINVNDTTANQHVGLFGAVRKATVKNLTVKDAQIDVVAAKAYAGAVFGMAHSNSENHTTANLNFENITVDGCTINAESKSGSAYVGGLTGYCYPANMTDISVSNLTINPKASGSVFTGGMVGYMQGQNISNNSNTRAYYTVDTFNLNNITIKSETNDSLIGGFAGYTYYGYITLKNAAIDGFKVEANVAKEALIGGLIGLAHRSDKGHTFTDVEITGLDIDVVSDSGVDVILGGMVGYSGSPIAYSKCSVDGEITETTNNTPSSAIAGGFVGGTVSWAQSYSDCVADVDVTGTNYTGGFVGYNGVTATYTDCEAKGTVEGTTAGGFVGDTVNGTYIECTYTGESDVPFCGTAGVTSLAYVAQIGETKYTSLAKAIEKAAAGETITVIADHEVADSIVVDKNVTIDLGGKTISAAETLSSKPVIRVLAEVTVTNGTVDGTTGINSYAFIVGNSETTGTLNIADGTYKGITSAISITNGIANISGGTFSTGHDDEGTDYGAQYLLNCMDAAYTAGTAKYNITGGTFVGFNPENNAAEGAGTNFVVTNGLYHATEENGTYTVAEWNGEIHNKADLLFFQKKANAGNKFSGKTIKLMANIDLDGMTWTPVKNFLGTFDGGNHTISNFHLDATKDHAGFFYKIDFGNGTAIKNLTLSDITATVGNYYVGALAYFSFAVQDNITIKNFTVTTTASEAKVGGYAGWVEWGHIRNCTIENMVVNAENGAGLIGGLAAVLKADNWLQYNNIDVKGFKVTIHDTDNTYAEVGGLVGQTQTGHDAPVFTNCDITGIDVTASGLVTVGGFVARPGAHTTAKNCTTEGKIDVTGVTSADESAGGFFGNLGWNNNESSRGGHKLTNCSANVDIITKIAPAGGFVGSATNEQNRNMAAAFTNCIASGDIIAVEGGTANIGGFAGEADRGTYTDCAYIGESDVAFIGGQPTNATIITSVAQIGTKKYTTLQAAIDAAVNGDTIGLLAEVTENVTIVQAPDVVITIDGNDQTMSGTITVDGKSAAYATAGLTIKNVKFDATDVADTCISLGASGNNNTRYTSNVTVENCTFTGEGNVKAAIKNYTGGCKNLTVKDCTAEGMHSLVQVKGIAGLTVSGGSINGKNGISVGTSTGVEISDVEITATGYGVRADGEGAYDMSVTNCEITADLPVVVRKATGAYELTVTGGELTATNEKGYAVVFTNGDDGTFEVPTGSFEAQIDEGIKSYPMSAYVAQVGEKNYVSLQAAVDAAQSGDTIKLIGDIVLDDINDVEARDAASNGNGKYCGFDYGNGAFFNVINKGDLTVDLNGHSITYDLHDDAWCNKRVVSLFYVTDKTNLAIVDNSAEKTGAVTVYGMATAVYSVAVDTKVNIKGGTWTWYPCKTCGATNVFLYASHGGELYITGGKFVNKVTGSDAENMVFSHYSSKETTENSAGVDYDRTKIEISGGTFDGYNPAEIKYMDQGNGNAQTKDDGCAPGYETIENDDGTYGVKEWDGVINNKADLLTFAEAANAGNTFSGKTIKLMANIDLGGMTWTPIAKFAGTFEGGNHTIKNFHIDATAGHGGFFNVLDWAKVYDLNIADVTATVGAYRFGTLARSINQTCVERVTVKDVTVTTTNSTAFVAGLFCHGTVNSDKEVNDCTVENLTVNAANGAYLIAGITTFVQKNGTEAEGTNIFDNLHVKNFKVTVADTDGVCALGGLVGQTQSVWQNPRFNNCSVTGLDVAASGAVDVGGFMAYPGSWTYAENCTTEGKIDVTGVTNENCYAGGFFGNFGWGDNVGKGDHKVTNCSANVDIITKMANAGGFVGSGINTEGRNKNITFTGCTASGDIIAIAGGTANIGSFVGYADRGVYDGCSASGTVTNNGAGYAGQFVGALNEEAFNNYNGSFTDCTYTGASTALKFIGNEADVEIVENVAQIGEGEDAVLFASLQAAIDAATAGNTIVLLADIEENVEIKMSLTIDGTDFKYTGTMTVSGNVDVTIQNVEFVKGYINHSSSNTSGNLTVKSSSFTNGGYAVTTERINSVTIEDVTVTNQSLLYAKLSTLNINVKDVTIDNGNYLAHIVYGDKATFENVTATNMPYYGICTQNHGAKTITLKNCDIDAQWPVSVWAKSTATDTFVFEGENKLVGENSVDYAAYKLAAADATLEAAEGLTVTTDVEHYDVAYETGVYKMVAKNYVAEVNGTKYESLQAAINAAQTGDEIVLLSDIDLTEADRVVNADRNVLIDVAGKDITLDLNGQKISVVHEDEFTNDYIVAVIRVADGAGLTVTGNGTIDVKVLAENPDMAYMFWKRGTTGHLTVENGTFHMNDSADSMVYTNGNEIVNIKGGTWTLDAYGTRGNREPWIFNVAGAGDNHVTVTGGTFNADINRQFWSNEVLVSETCYTVDNGNGTWTVTPGAKAYVKTGMLTGPYFAPKNIGYATFEEAFKAAVGAEDHKITLLADTDFEKTVTNDDLATVTEENGKTVYKLVIVKNGYTANGLTAAKGVKMTEIEIDEETQIVFEIDYVAQITKTDAEGNETVVQYASVAEALNAAQSGETVKLIGDAIEPKAITIWSGITLDLNGYTLEAPMAMLVNGSFIKDSTDGNGLMKVAKDYVVLPEENGQMPLYDVDNGGYRFFNLTVVNKGYRDEFSASKPTATGTMSYRFQIVFDNMKAYELLANYGASGCGVEVGFELTWDNMTSKPQVFVATDAYIKNAAAQMVAAGKIGTFSIVLKGFSHLEGRTLTGTPMVISGTNVSEYVDTAIDYTVPVK